MWRLDIRVDIRLIKRVDIRVDIKVNNRLDIKVNKRLTDALGYFSARGLPQKQWRDGKGELPVI